jgi:hypothetical protein
MQYFHVDGWLISLRGTRSISHADRRVFCDQRECVSHIIPDIRLKPISLCFLLFLGYSTLSMGQVVDSPLGISHAVADSLHPRGERIIAPLVSENAVLYGELINPDSLGPIKIRISPFRKILGDALPDSVLEIQTTHGTFFDGVLDPRVRKFRVVLPEFTQYAYVSLTLGDRAIMDDFLIFPTDSAMIGIDLQKFNTVFAGPDGEWLETQYLVQRAIKQHQFESPRVIIERDRDEFLKTDDYLDQYLAASQSFGAQLEIQNFGKDDIQAAFRQLDLPKEKIPGMDILLQRKHLLSINRFQILEQEILGTYYSKPLSHLRRYGYQIGKAQHNQFAVNKIESEVPGILESLKPYFSDQEFLGPGSGGLLLAMEWAKMKALLKGLDFQTLVKQEVGGLLHDQLLYTYALENVSRIEDPVAFLESIYPDLQTTVYSKHLKAIASRLAPGLPIEKATLKSLDGNNFSIREFKGKPTLFYFYFSTCSHSAKFFHTVLKPIIESGLPNQEFDLVAISVDNDPTLWKEQLSTYSSPDIPNYRLPSKEWKEWLDHYLISGYPRTMLVDSQSKILSIWVPGRTEESFKASLRELVPFQSTTSTTPSIQKP